MNVVLKRQIWQDGHAELGGCAGDPRVHMRCPFRGRVFTFFSSVPVTGTQFPVPSGAVWREPGLKCNLGSSQEYCRNLGLRFSNLLFLSPTPIFAWKEWPAKDLLLNTNGPSSGVHWLGNTLCKKRKMRLRNFVEQYVHGGKSIRMYIGVY